MAPRTKDSRLDDDDAEREPGSMDIMRKAALLALGSIFYSEETVRRMLSDVSAVPRDEAKRLYGFLIEQSQRSKDDLVGMVQNEVRRYFRKMDLESEIRKVLSGMKVRVEAEITFTPVEQADEPGERRVHVAVVQVGEPPTEPLGSEASADSASDGEARTRRGGGRKGSRRKKS